MDATPGVGWCRLVGRAKCSDLRASAEPTPGPASASDGQTREGVGLPPRARTAQPGRNASPGNQCGASSVQSSRKRGCRKPQACVSVVRLPQ